MALLTIASCTEEKTASPRAPCQISTEKINAFIALEGGEFRKGEGAIYPEERSGEVIRVAPFSILAHEVTNAQFAAFVDATDYVTDAEQATADGAPAGSAIFDPAAALRGLNFWKFEPDATWRTPDGPGSSIDGGDVLPVVHVSLNDARAYAEWAGGRLPTEDEWEYAAALGLADRNTRTSGAFDPDRKPVANTWQGIFPFDNTSRDGFAGIAPVGCFPASGAGLHDMIGNVWEWTDTPFGQGTHTIKGGSYLCAENFCLRYRPEARQPHETDFSTSHIGFRIVKAASPT